MPAETLDKFRTNAEVDAIVEAERIVDLALASPAKLCQCENPVTYTEPEGEVRCLCGREVR